LVFFILSEASIGGDFMRRSLATRRWKHKEEADRYWAQILLDPITLLILIFLGVIALIGYYSS
jgi:hypothetical protein